MTKIKEKQIFLKWLKTKDLQRLTEIGKINQIRMNEEVLKLYDEFKKIKLIKGGKYND